MGFKAKSIAVAPWAFMQFKDATNNLCWDGEGPERKPVGVELYGPGSPEHTQAHAKLQAASMERMRGGQVDPSSDDVVKEGAIFLAGLTRRFVNVDYEDGLDGEALAIAVWSDRSIGFWADQATAFTKSWGNFPKSSAKS